MFLIDKYQINYLNDIIFNKDLYKNILDISTLKKDYRINDINDILCIKKNNIYNNLPNLLFYGLEGSGKKSLINFLIKKIYNINEIILKKTIYKICGYGNNSIEVEIYHSQYHIIIEPYNTGFDKYLIQEVVKEYIKNKFIDLEGRNLYKIILINNIDKLSYYAQTSLRCTMEKYSNYCKFILCGQNISKIIEPIKSRCLFIKVPRPSGIEILDLILTLTYKEKLFLKKKDMLNLLNNFSNNIKLIIWNLDLNKHNINNKINLEESIDYIFNLLKNKVDVFTNIKLIRERLYLLFITNIDFKLLLKTFLDKIYFKINDKQILLQIIKKISDTDLNISLGKRIVIHFENLIYNIMFILNENDIII